MKIFLYFKALFIVIKNKFGRFKSNKFANIVWIESIKRYIVFCSYCGEYICDDGLCSNPVCPEIIKDENYES